MSKAKDKQHFIDTWERHARELRVLVWSLPDEHFTQLEKHISGLNKLIEIAADHTYDE